MNDEQQPAKKIKTVSTDIVTMATDTLAMASDKVAMATENATAATDSATDNSNHLDPVPGKCQFFIKKKKRFCKTDACREQKQYCVIHMHELGFVQPGKKRITCPLDPKHSCYEEQLERHLKKCNARSELNPVCYVHNINSGEADGEDPEEYKVGIRDISDEEVLELVKTVNKLHAEHVGVLEDCFLFHDVLQTEAQNPKNGNSAQKHIKQQASLIGHMNKAGLLRDETSYLEFGAGKGGLSHWVQLALNHCKHNQYILIDKGSVRYKMDTYHRGPDQGPNFQRVKIDIQDLHLGKLSSLQNDTRPIVGLGKHLCGGATDLMLRCLMETSKTEQDRLKSDVSGLVLALCCHHRCDWRSYCGKELFRRCGLGARGFHLVTSMTSWATCGTRPVTANTKAEASEKNTQDGSSATNQDALPENTQDGSSATNQDALPENTLPENTHDAPQDTYRHHRYGNLLPQEREEIGRRCKQLIDRGRVNYLIEHGYKTEQTCYTDREHTLENMALIATYNGAPVS